MHTKVIVPIEIVTKSGSNLDCVTQLFFVRIYRTNHLSDDRIKEKIICLIQGTHLLNSINSIYQYLRTEILAFDALSSVMHEFSGICMLHLIFNIFNEMQKDSPPFPSFISIRLIRKCCWYLALGTGWLFKFQSIVSPLKIEKCDMNPKNKHISSLHGSYIWHLLRVANQSWSSFEWADHNNSSNLLFLFSNPKFECIHLNQKMYSFDFTR